MKIFIINLEDRKDRLNYMKEEIKKIKSLEHEFIFFKAIAASKNEHLNFKQYFSPFRVILRRAKNHSNNELACYASHFCLWQKCIELNEAIIILEDDIRLENNFLTSLKEIQDSNFEYVRLGFTDKKKFISIKGNFYYTLEDIAGAQGYYLKPSAAKKFSSARFWVLPVDLYMDYVADHKVSNILYLPPVVRNNDDKNFVSSIQTNQKEKKRFVFKIARELFRILIVLRKFIFKIFYKP